MISGCGCDLLHVSFESRFSVRKPLYIQTEIRLFYYVTGSADHLRTYTVTTQDCNFLFHMFLPSSSR